MVGVNVPPIAPSVRSVPTVSIALIPAAPELFLNTVKILRIAMQPVALQAVLADPTAPTVTMKSTSYCAVPLFIGIGRQLAELSVCEPLVVAYNVPDTGTLSDEANRLLFTVQAATGYVNKSGLSDAPKNSEPVTGSVCIYELRIPSMMLFVAGIRAGLLPIKVQEV